MEMDRRRPWSNLPEGIVELIISKLHFPDQIRALAVCKDWQSCKDYIRCSGCLPWVISSQRAFDVYSDSDDDGLAFGFIHDSDIDSDSDDDNAEIVDDLVDIGDDAYIVDVDDYDDDSNVGDDDEFLGERAYDIDSGSDDGNDDLPVDDGNDDHSSLRELFDPYSRKVSQVSNPILMDTSGSYIPLAAKNGWVWALFVCKDSSKVMFHNPFTNEIRSVYPFPKMKTGLLHATIKGDPASPDFEIFTIRICADELHVDSVKGGSYTSDSIVQKLDERYDFIYDELYINGYIYCLFRGGKLFRYGLEDRSWNLLTSGFPEPYVSRYNMLGDWLLEIEGNIIMVRMDVEDEIHTWMIFRFDWSKMSWVNETGLKSRAIYISDFLAFSTPLKSSNGEILEGCRLFHNEDRGFKCYSLSEAEAGGVEIQSDEYSWIIRPSRFQLSFIERPYFGI